MPEEFDPRWEYFAADSEVLEAVLLNGQRVSGRQQVVSSFYQEDVRTGKVRTAGVRFSRGNPATDTYQGVMSEKPPDLGPSMADMASRKCQCGKEFIPRRKNQAWCSPNCWRRNGGDIRGSAGAGRPRTLADIPCAYCGILFRPWNRTSRCCSRSCATHTYWATRVDNGKPRFRTTNKERLQRFRDMYLTGSRMRDIAEELQVHQLTLRVYRKKLALPPRPTGHSHAATNKWLQEVSCLIPQQAAC